MQKTLLSCLAMIGALSVAFCGAARAQALVIDGEEIADAKLMAAAKAEGKLSVYNWGDYINPEVLQKFGEEYEVDVSLDTYGTNEEWRCRGSARRRRRASWRRSRSSTRCGWRDRAR